MATTCYIAAHPKDAEWMIGETVANAKHAFRSTGYDLGDLVYFAARQKLVVMKIDADGVIRHIYRD